MSSYYDCSPETNNTKVKVYGKGTVYSEKTTDIINNITGIFMLLTSIGATFLIIFGSKTAIESVKHPTQNHTNLLFLLTVACMNIIIGLIGMYNKSPETSIYGFTSFILIGVYTIFLFISGKLKDIEFGLLTDKIFVMDSPINGVPLIILVVLLLLSSLLYGLVYKNVKKSKNRRINSQRKRQRNTAHAIFVFSVVGSVLFALFISKILEIPN